MVDSLAMTDLALAMLRLVVLASLPAVLTAALVGLLVGFVQAVTQLQDQASSFALKFIAVAAVVALTIPWMSKAFNQFMRQLFDGIVAIS